MLLSILIFSALNGPPPAAAGCSVSGTVELLHDGAPINPEGKVVVYLDGKMLSPDRKPVAHTVQQIKLDFKPSLVVLQKGDTIDFVNEDTEAHSVYSPTTNPTPSPSEFPTSKRGVTGTMKFLAPGPIRIHCDVHYWMRADVLVLENPHYAEVDSEGRWTIRGMPDGDHTLTVWEKNGTSTKILVKQCNAPMTVAPTTLNEGAYKKPRKKTGGVRREY